MYDKGPAGGPGAGVSTGPRDFPQVEGTSRCWSGGGREGADALPGLDDRLGPGPAGGDLPASAASAADQAGGGVQDAVASLNYGMSRIFPVSWPFPGCVLDDGEQQAGVTFVEAGDSVAEVDWDAGGEAGG